MATFALKFFSRAETLHSIKPSRLAQFLRPFMQFFEDRGLPWPRDGTTQVLCCEQLEAILMTPDDSMPQGLVDSLSIIDEMSTPEAMDALIDAAGDAGIVLDHFDDDAPIDVAIQLWLTNRDLVEMKDAEQRLFRPRAFRYFRRNHVATQTFTTPDKAALLSMELKLDRWFDSRRRGTGSRVFVFQHQNLACFLIRHGKPLRREGRMDGKRCSSILYRPAQFDVAIYDPALGELRVHADTEGEREIYRECFAALLFNDGDCFGDADKFTLEPLRLHGEFCLACDDIDGIDNIMLTEIAFYRGGGESEFETHRADNVFAAFELRNQTFPALCKIEKASFLVQFAGSKKPRTVKVSVPNRTNCLRDHDSTLFDRWLEARGFVIGRDSESAESEIVEEVLVEH